MTPYTLDFLQRYYSSECFSSLGNSQPSCMCSDWCYFSRMIAVVLFQCIDTEVWEGWKPSKEMTLYCGSFFSQQPTLQTPSQSCTSYHLSGGSPNMVLCLGLFLSISNLGDKMLILFDLINNIKYHRAIMEHKQKILQYYTTGRYQCDYEFHQDLLKVLKELNLYEWQPKLQNQAQLVKKIKQLTDLNNQNSEDDFEDENLISQTYKIKSLIGNICTKDIHAIIQECEDLGWQSYAQKIHEKMDGKPNYDKILERIKSTVHSEQFRIDSMMFATLFEMVNGQQINQLITTYSSTVEFYLNYLTNCNKKIEAISESSKISNICALPKVKYFVTTNYSILRLCLRFCEIVKVLAGKNNLTLKFTVIKKQMEKLIKLHPQWKISDEKQDIFGILGVFREYLKKRCNFDKDKVCRWCFKLLKKQKKEHSFCRYLVQNRNSFTVKSD